MDTISSLQSKLALGFGNFMGFLKRNKNIAWLFAIILLFFTTTFIVQVYREWIPPWSEPYFIIRTASSPSVYDSLSAGGRFAAYEYGTQLLLNLIANKLGIWVWYLIPMLIGGLSLILFYLILKRLGIDSTIPVAMLAFSPAFIALFITLNLYFFAFFLGLLGFYFVTGLTKAITNRVYRKSFWINSTLGFIVALFLPIFNFSIALAFIFICVVYGIFWGDRTSTNNLSNKIKGDESISNEASLMLSKKPKKFALAISGLCFTSFFVYLLYFIKNAGVPRLLVSEVGLNNALRFLLFEFGNSYGIGLFALLLAFIYIIVTWDKKYDNLFFFVIFVAFFIIGLISISGILVLNAIISILSYFGIVWLWNKKWANNTFRKYTLFVFILGLLFSFVAAANNIVHAEPDRGQINGIIFLGEQKDGVVLSHISRGHWITFAGQKNIVDENKLFLPNFSYRIDDINKIFYTRDIREAKEIIEKYEITYIWIDISIKEKIWRGENEGLLFLLKYGSVFEKIYKEGGVEIWRIDREKLGEIK